MRPRSDLPDNFLSPNKNNSRDVTAHKGSTRLGTGRDEDQDVVLTRFFLPEQASQRIFTGLSKLMTWLQLVSIRVLFSLAISTASCGTTCCLCKGLSADDLRMFSSVDQPAAQAAHSNTSVVANNWADRSVASSLNLIYPQSNKTSGFLATLQLK